MSRSATASRSTAIRPSDFVVIRRHHLIGTRASTLVLLLDLPTET